jgi:hypothetical protein
MSQPTPISTPLDLELQSRMYLDIIRQIDRIIQAPALTLVEMGARLPERSSRGGATSVPGAPLAAADAPGPRFPVWISQGMEHAPDLHDSILTRTVCLATIQRLQRIRRRFRWLDGDTGKTLHTAHQRLTTTLLPDPSESVTFDACRKLLHSVSLGGLSPLIASRVFLVLMEAGEEATHSAMGCLSFFAMVWPLHRMSPEEGVRMEPSEASTYVTSKCLVPLLRLERICRRRADLFAEVGQILSTLQECVVKLRAPTGNAHDHRRLNWVFTSELDDLRAHLVQLAEVAISRQALFRCAEEIGKISAQMTVDSDVPADFGKVVRLVAKALADMKERADAAHRQVGDMIDEIQRELVARLDPSRGSAQLREGVRWLEEVVGLQLAPEYLSAGIGPENPYLQHLFEAARDSCSLCEKVRDGFNKVRSMALPDLRGRGVVDPARTKMLLDAIGTLAEENRELAREIRKPVARPAEWCKKVMDREIAYVTSQNATEFDPSELVSAIAVSVRNDLLTTSLQVSDAVSKAITGQRPDGGWHMGKPIYAPDHVLGLWPPTVDIVWTLTNIIELYPTVREADRALFRFVDWLERTRVTVARDGAPEVTGWPSDRMRHGRRIHFLVTALAVDALLEIRDLCEHRLWELCEQRFTVLDEKRPLKEVDPVDLGLPHSRRVHGILSGMSIETQLDAKDAIYSLILHGPPGTSKTALVKALSVETWKTSQRWRKGGSRLIQITPADFTRVGPAQIDSEARVIFELLGHVRRVTILFDEIDDLLRRREHGNRAPGFMDLTVPAMLNRLADLRSACPRQEICFVFATNYIERIEEALMRSGRIDRRLAVVYPDLESRRAVIGKHVEKLIEAGKKAAKQGSRTEAADLERAALCLAENTLELAKRSSQWSWMSLDMACAELAASLRQDPVWQPDRLQELCDRFDAQVIKPDYRSRFVYGLHSGDLAAEYLAYVFSEQANRREADAKEPVLRGAIREEFPEIAMERHEPWIRRLDERLKEIRENPLSLDRAVAAVEEAAGSGGATPGVTKIPAPPTMVGDPGTSRG